MADVTAIHGLPFPEGTDVIDTLRVHTAVENLANGVDTKLSPLTSGTYASRPAAGKAGQRYRQTNDAGSVPAQTIWFDDGTNWIVERFGGHTAAVQALTATGNISATAGEIVTFAGAAAQTLTMPAGKQGMKFVLANIDSADNVTIAVQTGEKIDGVTNETIVVGPGERVAFHCSADGDYSTMRTEAYNSNDARIVRVAPVRGIQAFTASGNILATGAEDVTFVGAASQTLTLPAASPGMAFTVRNLDTTDVVTVARAGSDTINNALTSVYVAQGLVVDFFCDASGHWTATERVATCSALMFLANSGAPTHNSTNNWQFVHAGGGTDTWTSALDVRPNGVAAQVDTATNKRLDIKVDGIYIVHMGIYFTALVDAVTYGVALGLNGSRYNSKHMVKAPGGASDCPLDLSAMHNVVAGNSFGLMAYQASGGNEEYLVSEAWANYISMVRQGPNW